MGNVAGRLGPRRAFSWKRPRCEAPATLKIGPALTAATALRTSFPAAGADEEPELQVKQELLRQRIEQLASRAGGSVPAGTTMLGGSFPRSFLIPGSDTSIRVGGFVDETFNYYFQNGPPNGTQSTTVGITGNLATQALDVLRADGSRPADPGEFGASQHYAFPRPGLLAKCTGIASQRRDAHADELG